MGTPRWDEHELKSKGSKGSESKQTKKEGN
jgi:hypothetical protein